MLCATSHDSLVKKTPDDGECLRSGGVPYYAVELGYRLTPPAVCHNFSNNTYTFKKSKRITRIVTRADRKKPKLRDAGGVPTVGPL